MTTVFGCLNGWCKYMENLRCQADEIEIDNGGQCVTFEPAGLEDTTSEPIKP